MVVMLPIVLLTLLVLTIVLFRDKCKRGSIWMFCTWASLWCYARCCLCSKRYSEVISDRGEELRKFTVDDEDDLLK